MRIAMLSWEALHAVPVGGVAVFVSELAAELARAGHEVHIFTRLGPEQRLVDDIAGVRYHRCPVDRHSVFLDEARRGALSILHYLGETVRADRPFDWVAAHDWMMMEAALEARGALAERMAAVFHTTEWGRSGEWPAEGVAREIASLERKGMEEADAVFTVGREVRRELEAQFHGPDWKTAVLSPGIRTGRFDATPFDPGAVKRALGLDVMAPVVLFVGRLVFAKGPDLFLEAANVVHRQRPDARFLLVGEGEMRTHLEREVERFALGEAVRFLGAAGGRALTDLYRASDLVCSPARRDPFGIVTLSAWAASKPVVLTPVGEQGEIAWDGVNGVVAQEAAPAALGAAILDLFSDFDRLRWMGRNGRVAVETAFAWERTAEAFVEGIRRARRLSRPGAASAAP